MKQTKLYNSRECGVEFAKIQKHKNEFILIVKKEWEGAEFNGTLAFSFYSFSKASKYFKKCVSRKNSRPEWRGRL